MARALLLGTVETKRQQLAYLSAALRAHGVQVDLIDVSLGSGGAVWSGARKLIEMAVQAQAAVARIARDHGDCTVAVGLGGGTGGEIVLAAMKGLPGAFPKVLITTLAFDPRPALADTAITLIPTLCDIEGLNAPLRQVFENAAAMVAGLGLATMIAAEAPITVALTTLGATGAAGAEVSRLLVQAGIEPVVFHANGYGGAAFSRFVAEGRVHGVIDLNVHELGRIRLGGAHVAMPDRFTVAARLPRVILPGALNFIGLGAVETLRDEDLARPHYRHTGQFTHVKLTMGEMADQATALADLLNRSQAPCRVLIPMEGFSHEDRPGGAIEDAALREIAADTLERAARAYDVTRLPEHINSPVTAGAVVAALHDAMQNAMTQRTDP